MPGVDALAVTGAVGIAYAAGLQHLWSLAGRGRIVRLYQPWLFGAGLATVVAALVGPLDTAADSSFTAHMTQHVLLMVVASPLLALGAPLPTLIHAFPDRPRRRLLRVWRWAVRSHQGGAWWAWMATAVVLQSVALWGWHEPGAFQAAVRNNALHGIEHTTLLVTSVFFWWTLVTGRRSRILAGILALFFASLPGTALGAAMTLSGHAWYPLYGRGLGGQQMGGVIMWALGGAIYVVAAAALFFAWLAGIERATPGVIGVGERFA